MTAPPDPQAKSTMRKLGGAAIIMITAMLLSRVIGLLRNSYVGAKFGPGPDTDAFVAAFTLPDWLNYLLAGGALSITLLPIYSRYLVENDEAEGNRVFSIVASVMLVVVLVGVFVGEWLAVPIVSTFFHNLAPDAVTSCIRFTKILLPAQVCFILGPLASATLLARGRFLAVAMAPLIYNFCIIASAFLFGDSMGVESLAWGAVAGAFLGPFLVPTVDALRHGLRFHLTFAVRHPTFVEWIKLSLPMMIGVSLTTADSWVIRYFAGMDEGAITRLDFAKKVALAAIAVAGQAVGQASMPFFSRLFAEGKREQLVETFVGTVIAAVVSATLLCALMAGIAKPIVTILFGYGKFTATDIDATAVYMAIFAAAIPVWTLQGLTARLFYAARNTLTPMIASTVMMLVSLPLYALALRLFGIAGLAMASGVGILLNTAALFWLTPRILPELVQHQGRVFGQVARGLLLASLGGGGALFATRALGHTSLPSGPLGALLSAAVGGVAFLLIVALAAKPLKVSAPVELSQRLRKRFG